MQPKEIKKNQNNRNFAPRVLACDLVYRKNSKLAFWKCVEKILHEKAIMHDLTWLSTQMTIYMSKTASYFNILRPNLAHRCT